MHSFTTNQVSNGFIVTFSAPPFMQPMAEETYVFLDAKAMAEDLPRILRRRELIERRARRARLPKRRPEESAASF